VGKGGGQDAIPGAADHQGRSPDRAREQDGVVDPMEPPLERDAFAGQEPADDLEGLLESGPTVVEGKPEGPELDLVPPRAEAEHQAAAADLIDRGRHLGQDAGDVERGTRHQRAQPDPLGHGGQPGQERPRLPRTALRSAVAPVQEVVADPQGIEAHLLRRAGHGHILGPRDPALDLWELDAHAKPPGHGPEV
jgi:hypothetical protein